MVYKLLGFLDKIYHEVDERFFKGNMEIGRICDAWEYAATDGEFGQRFWSRRERS